MAADRACLRSAERRNGDPTLPADRPHPFTESAKANYAEPLVSRAEGIVIVRSPNQQKQTVQRCATGLDEETEHRPSRLAQRRKRGIRVRSASPGRPCTRGRVYRARSATSWVGSIPGTSMNLQSAPRCAQWTCRSHARGDHLGREQVAGVPPNAPCRARDEHRRRERSRSRSEGPQSPRASRAARAARSTRDRAEREECRRDETRPASTSIFARPSSPRARRML